MAASINATLCGIDEIDKYNFDDFDIIGFGSGISFGKHYEELIDAVRGLDVSNRNIFVFSTCGSGSKSQNSALIKVLKERGANIIGNFTCKGYDTYGPFKLIGGISKGHPSENDIEMARKFITHLEKKVVYQKV
jgi:flavodoxin